MPRRTRIIDIDTALGEINRWLGRNGYGYTLIVTRHAGGTRVHKQKLGKTYHTDLSPRLPLREAHMWLVAYAQGLDTGLNQPENTA